MSDRSPLSTGVVGAGTMGRHHARIYSSHPASSFVGVHDIDGDRASNVASEYDVEALDAEELLDRVEAVSIAVPTRHHYAIARRALERGVHVLVEKPIAKDPDEGRKLVDLAATEEVVLQVGHIERFNPAVTAVLNIVPDLEIVAIEARRLGPPVNRDSTDSVALDLMIHDIDIVRTMLDAELTSISAKSARNGQYVDATMSYDSGAVAHFTASRLTQRKVRKLTITATECYITVDFADQDVLVHRHSVPEFVPTNGNVKYRHESIIERPVVENGEPLERELESFMQASRTDEAPAVSGEDGLRALELALAVEERTADVGRIQSNH